MAEMETGGQIATLLAANLAESKAQSAALQEMVSTQREHSKAFTLLLERQGGGARSNDSESVKWPTLGAILTAIFAPIALIVGFNVSSIGAMGQEMDRWSTEHDRTFGPLVTDHASLIDSMCQRLQILSKEKGIEFECPRAIRPWPNGDRGGR